MKLRNLLLIIVSCFCLPVIGQEFIGLSFLSGSIEPKLHPVEGPVSFKERLEAPVSSEKARLRAKREAEDHQEPSQWLDWSRVQTRKAAESGKLRLDSIIGTNPDGSNYTRQYFVFNGQNKVIQRLNSFWDASTKTWTTVEEYNFEWDEDGYVLMQSVEAYGGGQRFEYIYNDKKWGIEQVIYSLDDVGNWVKVQKSEYKYDDRANIIDEMVYLWKDNGWVKAAHNAATWDEENRQTSFLSMSWNGAEWIGESKEDYTWYAKDQLSYKGMWRWLDDSKEWQLVDVFFQEFNQAGQCTAQRRKFWNDDRKDWGGEYESWGPLGGICVTYDAIITYDELGRAILQQHKECCNDSTEWVVKSEMITEWTDGLENGDYESEMNAYLYIGDTNEKIWNQQEFERYNAKGLRTWLFNRMQSLDGTEMNDNYEEKYTFDERGNLTYSAVWDWKDGKRTPTIEEKNTYDANDSIIESYYRQGKGNGSIPFGTSQKVAGYEEQDDKDWENTSHFTYTYKNGVRTEKLKWKWNGTEWVADSGSEVEYDWNVPTSELITMDGYLDPYKIDFIFNYIGNGANDWLAKTDTYYYTDKLTGMQKVVSGNITFDNNVLKINEGDEFENRVYDMTGKLVYAGHQSEENLSHLSTGIYIVNSCIDGASFTLKIAIR